MKNREEHTLPVSDAAFAILLNRPRHGALVFPTQGGKPYLNWTPLLRRIRERVGESDRPAAQRFRLHDIRRSFNSILCEEGFSEDALDLMLAHKRTSMKAIYNLAKLMPERERASARWARLLTGPESARALQQSELRLLKSQLNPHFLFNALNTVRSLIADDPSRAQHAVTHLANTLRYTLGAGQNELVSLARELEIVADFLELEKMRFEARLTIEREIAADASSAQIPVMLLQTVVENAIKHGIAELPAGGVLRICAVLSDGMLVLSVENPRPAASVPPAREGTGLRNAEERLRLLFDSRATLELDLSQPTRATTRIRIPQHS
jgi:hypothetical protein